MKHASRSTSPLFSSPPAADTDRPFDLSAVVRASINRALITLPPSASVHIQRPERIAIGCVNPQNMHGDARKDCHGLRESLLKRCLCISTPQTFVDFRMNLRKLRSEFSATPLESLRNSLCVVMWMGRGSTYGRRDMAGMAFVHPYTSYMGGSHLRVFHMNYSDSVKQHFF